MDETQISITVKPIYVERLIYWILIIVLAVLLIIAYVKDDCTTDTTKTQPVEQKTTQETQPTPAPTQQANPTPAASCTDSKKNQDETDVDCGGEECGACADGKACTINADCISANCGTGTCKEKLAVPTLSGKVEFDVTNVEIQKATSKLPDNTTYNRVKVTGLSFKIINGQAEDLKDVIVRVYVKNKANVRCLNQQSSGTCDDSYAEFSIASVASGKTLSTSHTFAEEEFTTKMGRYLTEDNGYDPTDSVDSKFNVVAFLYDSDGNPIDGKSLSDSYLVTP